MSWEILFIGVFFAMAGSVLFFSKSPQSDQLQAVSQGTKSPEPPPILRPPERMFDFSKIILLPKNGPSLSQVLVMDGEGGLLFYVESKSSLMQGLHIKIYMNQTKQDLLLIVNKEKFFQMAPRFSFYDAGQKDVGQVERDVLSGEKARWYLADAEGKRFAHMEKDKEAIEWSNLSQEPRHSEKYNIFPGTLIAGTFNRDDYNPYKYILNLNQDNGQIDRRIALCMALVLMHK